MKEIIKLLFISLICLFFINCAFFKLETQDGTKITWFSTKAYHIKTKDFELTSDPNVESAKALNNLLNLLSKIPVQ